MPNAHAPVELMRTELPFPVQVDNYVLAGAAKTATKPAGVVWALISVSSLCYMTSVGTAIVPVADTGSGGGAPAAGAGSFPVHPGQNLLFNVKSILAFSIIGTAVAAVAWYGDHGGGL